ncbi:RNA-guided endonuclease InsQ/TnpB family protein [Coleofasciculus sp. F4-SAH-05]|uniref:RNA-guided endonuclease InsQ/TnpB family protein n=1 Tax=Coleofasciculus sp. F4-SAH-05 TaxID=3069525 RepID=UPI003301ED47
MKLVEKHVVCKGTRKWKEIDNLAFKSKNLYNRANYEIRQHFFKTNQILSYNEMASRMQTEESYCALPRKVSQQVLRCLDRNWKAWKEANKAYKKNPVLFLGKPKLPKYKDKEKGRNLLVYTIQAISSKELQKGWIKPSGTNLMISCHKPDINEVRIVPRLNYYVVEVIYEQPIQQLVSGEAVAGVDIGLNNLAAVTSNQKGFKPFLINGRPVKAINNYYNKKKAELQSQLKGNRKTSNRIQRLSTKRGFKIDDYLHKSSRFIINQLVENNISNLVIGKNENWKQGIRIGKVNNQNFTSVPHARFIEMLTYKAELIGIKVIITEESYTSVASFLDGDFIPVHGSPEAKAAKFSGRRVKRGLYFSKIGVKFNADINGSYNIIRKVVPDAFGNGIEGVVVHPVKITLAN